MQDAVYHQYARVFESHWWSEHRRRFIGGWLRQLGVHADGSHAGLESGCGAGTARARECRL